MSAAQPLLQAVGCPSCGAQIDGRFCRACGQRAPAADDFTTRRFFAAAWRELSDGDSRSLQTLRALLLPGELTRAFIAHEWRRYLPPLRLYLIASGVFFLLCWETYFRVQFTGFDPQVILQNVPPHLHARVLAALEDPRMIARSSDITAIARFFSVPLLGLVVALLQRGRRLPFGVHLVFATHYYVFDYVLFTLATPLFLLLPAGEAVAGGGMLAVLMLCLLGWAVLAVRRVYARGWSGASAAGVAILLADLLLSSLAGQVGFSVALSIGMGEHAAAAALSPG